MLDRRQSKRASDHCLVPTGCFRSSYFVGLWTEAAEAEPKAVERSATDNAVRERERERERDSFHLKADMAREINCQPLVYICRSGSLIWPNVSIKKSAFVCRRSDSARPSADAAELVEQEVGESTLCCGATLLSAQQLANGDQSERSQPRIGTLGTLASAIEIEIESAKSSDFSAPIQRPPLASRQPADLFMILALSFHN